MEGSIYSVDEVSDLLGIPRPTLYRYLREYSIPHLRRAGRIQIPEDSFDRIREARDLHKEGLGTDSVRRQLREGGGPDTGELDRRLNSLHDTLEDLRGELRERPATGEVALSPALRTVLARQSLMLSAMFNLTGMVEDLLLANGRPRKRPLENLRGGADHTALLPAENRAGIPGAVLVEPAPVREAEAPEVLPPASIPPPDGPTRFGSLGRRRRRGVLALLSALLLGLLLALFLPKLAEDGTETAGTPAPEKAAAGGGAEQAPGDEGPESPARPEATQQGAADDGKGDAPAAGTKPPAEGTTSGEASVRSARAPGPSGTVPDVSGRSLEEAAGAVSEAGFSVAAIKTEKSPEDPGTVLKAEPSTGTDARPGTSLVLTMSGGPTGASSADAYQASAPSTVASSASASPTSVSSAGGSASASPSP